MQLYIKYNPYTVTTDCELDGVPVAPESPMSIKNGVRLQEWIDTLPERIEKITDVNDLTIVFYGTPADFADVKETLAQANMTCQLEYEEPEIKDTNRSEMIAELFDEIQQGPIDELKTKEINDAFERAMDNKFKVNVIATMSAGKSTMINAMLGKEIMPSSQEACTAIITEINDNDQKEFESTVFDEQGNQLAHATNTTLEQMRTWNSDPNVATIKVDGDIPFTTSEQGNTNLVLVDTPGPNNARNLKHRETTRRALNSSSKTLIIYIINATQFGTDDDNGLLDKVRDSMRGSKSARDRFIFVVNKLDAFMEANENPEATLQRIREYLKAELDTDQVNLFGVSSKVALDVETKLKGLGFDNDLFDGIVFDQDTKQHLRGLKREELLTLKNVLQDINNFDGNEKLHFEKYAQLPGYAQKEIDERLKEAQANNDYVEQTLIHTGIPSVEQAIKAYVEKYAMPLKISNIVNTFESVMAKTQADSSIEAELLESEDKREEFAQDLQKIQERLEKISDGQDYAKMIAEKINVMDDVKQEANEKIEQVRSKFTQIQQEKIDTDEEYTEDEAEEIIEKLEDSMEKLQSDLNIDVEEIIEVKLREQAQNLLSEYERKLQDIYGDTMMPAPDLNSIHIEGLDMMSEFMYRITDPSIYTHHDAEEYTYYDRHWWNPVSWFKSYTGTREAYDSISGEDLMEIASDSAVAIEEYREDLYQEVNDRQERVREFFENTLKKLDEDQVAQREEMLAQSKRNKENKAELERLQNNLNWLNAIKQKLAAILAI